MKERSINWHIIPYQELLGNYDISADAYPEE